MLQKCLIEYCIVTFILGQKTRALLKKENFTDVVFMSKRVVGQK